MSADLINLRQVKKNLARDQAAKKAQENRIKFGRSKAEKQISQIEINRAAKTLDGKELKD
jgi:Domain of unknown function (DUF4169)